MPENRTSAAQIAAVKRYNDSRDRLTLRPTQEEGQQIRQAAADAGQSVQGYILDAVRQRMQADK